MGGAEEGFKNEANWPGCGGGGVLRFEATRGVVKGFEKTNPISGLRVPQWWLFTLRSQFGHGGQTCKNEPKVGFVWRASGWRGFGKTNPILREANFTLRSRLGEKLAGERRFGEGDGSRFGI
jgi:hypothetical protein